MIEWFYARGGQQHGPISFEQLVELAGNGGLDPINDNVWTASMQDWQPAGQVPGIFATASVPPVPAQDSSNPYAAPSSQWSDASAASSGPDLPEIVPGSEQLDPMACINRGYELAKRQFADIAVVALVYFVCLMGASMLFNLVEQLFGAIASRISDVPEVVVGVGIFFLVIGQIVLQLFSLFLKLGITRVGLNLVSGREVSVGMLFGEGPKLLRAFGASILFGIVFMLGLVLLIVPGIYFAMRYGQFLTAIVDRDLGIMESFSYSESITANNRMNLFVFGFLAALVCIVGFLMCCVGFFFAWPVAWLAAQVAYRWLQYGPRAAEDHPGTQTPMLTRL